MTEENIHVIIRFRPTNKREKKEEKEKKIKDKPPIFQNDDTRGIGVVEISGPKSVTPHNFTFDRILDANQSQESVFNHVAKHVCDDILIGYNGCIFAYGQTGSGKTYTMFGPEGDSDHPKKMGIIPRSVSYIFSEIEDHPDIIDARIKVSFVEIYREKLRDLLNPSSKKKSKKKNKKPLSIRMQPNGETRILNVKEKKVKTILDVLSLIEVANSYRTKAETSMNHSSSRSHMLMTLTVTLRLEDGSMHVGKLNFCDLAGSEKVRKTNATGDRLKEAQKINLSLTVLGQVISALSKDKKHVPYRDSQLTHVLKDSLHGNCKTTLIVNCTKHMFNRDETISSLRFGSRCKLIANEVKVNRTYSNKELLNMIEKLRRQNARLKAMLRDKGEEEDLDILTSPKGNKLFQKKEKKEKKKKKEKVYDDWGSTDSIGINKKSSDENKKLKKKLNKMEDKYHYLQLENNKLEDKLHAMNDQLYSFEKQSTMLNSRLVDYQAQTQDFNSVENENQELKFKIKSLEALNDEYRMEIGDMKKDRHYKATKLTHQLEKFKNLHQGAQEETTELMDEVLKLKQSAEKSEIIIDALDHQLTEKRKDMDNLQKELLNKERRVSNIFKEKVSLENRLKEIKTSVAKKDDDLSQQNEKIEQLKDELDQRTQELTAQIHELTLQLEQREMIQHSYSIRNTDPSQMDEIRETDDVKEADYTDLLIQSATIHNTDDVIQAEQSLLAQYDYLQEMETVRRESTLVDEKQKKLINIPSNPNQQKKAFQKEIEEKKKLLDDLRAMKRPSDKNERLQLFLKIGSLEDDVVQLRRKIKKLNKRISKVKSKDNAHDVSKVTTTDVLHYIDAALTLSAFKDEESDEELNLVT